MNREGYVVVSPIDLNVGRTNADTDTDTDAFRIYRLCFNSIQK